MKILIICSKAFYEKIPKIQHELEQSGHEVFLPNCYDAPQTESLLKGTKQHAIFKAEMFMQSEKRIAQMDAVLVLNFDKNNQKNYIGGATFLEMYDAFRLNKQIYMFNEIPEGLVQDEVIGFSPIIINGDLDKIKI